MISTATVNPVLTQHAVEYMRSSMGFVGMALCPAFASAVQSGDYYVWKKDNTLDLPSDIRRSPGAPFKRSLPKIGSDSFACRDYGHETPVPDEIRAKYRSHLNADVSAVRRNVEIIKVNHERRVKDLVTAGVPTTAVTLTWRNDAAKPKEDIDVAKESIRLKTGLRANVMVISEPVRLELALHPVIAERIKYTNSGVTTLQMLAAYFEVDRILVADQVENSTKEGQTVTPADIWGSDVFLAHVDASADLMRPTLGRTFYWGEFGSAGADDVPLLIESYREETVKSDIHRSQHFTDEKLVLADAGYKLTGAMAAP